MLNLKTGIHLDEIELAVFIEKFDGAGAAVFDLAHGVSDDGANSTALGCIERG